MSENNSWWDLIKYILSFIFGRIQKADKAKESERLRQKEHFKNINEDLQRKYEEIDRNKEQRKNQNVKDRLNDMF